MVFDCCLQINPVTARVHVIEIGTRMNAPSLNAGFSLIEVMVAILILAIALVGIDAGHHHRAGIEQGIGIANDRRAVCRRTNRNAPRRRRFGKRRDRWRLRRGLGRVSLEANRQRADIDGLHDVDVVVESAKDDQEIYELKTLLFEPDSGGALPSSNSNLKRKGVGKK